MAPPLRMATRYQLKIKRLDFISPVDTPAQETARVVLIKRVLNRKGSTANGKTLGAQVEGFARVAKVDENLGLVFCWAFTSTTSDGADYFDLQGDNVSATDFIKAAAEYMQAGGATDEMHDRELDGRVVFAMPMTAEIAKAFGVETKTTGLMIALKPSAAVLAKFKSGEYTGVSIDGLGERIELAKSTWSVAMIDDLPDSSFLYVEPGGTKTDDKTSPRSLRHFPYKDTGGAIDLPHLRDAASRIPQSSLPASVRDKLQVKAEKLIAAQHVDKRAPVALISKSVMLTTATAGHTHLVDDDGGAEAGETSWGQSSDDTDPYGYTPGHTHPWARTSDGQIVIGEAAGHVHLCITQPELDAIVAADNEGDVDEDDQLAGKRARKSPQQEAPKHLGTMTDAKKIEQLEADNAALLKRAERAEKALTFNAEHRGYFAKLAMAEQDNFVAKPAGERDAIVKAAIAHTAKDGTVYYNFDDPRLVKVAKAADDQADELAKARTTADEATIEKRVATEIPLLKGTTVEKAALLKAVAAIPDEPTRKAIGETLKGANAALALLGKTSGTGGDGGPIEGGDRETAMENLEKGLLTFCKTQNITKNLWTDGLAAFVKTDQGAALKAAVDNAAQV